MDERQATSPTTRDDGTRAALVLVHGAWHGGWCWQDVASLLRAAGHEVHTPTLTGLGEQAHLLEPRIDLETHVRDVVGLFTAADLREVTLVGHSYGGMVIVGAAEQTHERLSRLVFLDAFVPEDGQSLLDVLPPERRDLYLRGARERGDGWRVPPPPPQALGVTDEARARWLAKMLTPQPLATFEQAVRLTNAAAAALPRTYIHCTTGPLTPSFARFAARARADHNWDYHELRTGHDAMLIAPEKLSDALLGLAGATTGAG